MSSQEVPSQKEQPVVKCESVYKILYKNYKIKETIEKILSRKIKQEN